MIFTDKKIEDYCLQKSTAPHTTCDEIETYTKQNVAMPQMLIGKLEASLLGFLIKSISAKRILEIGTFTGYSALAMVEHLPADGELITLDISKENTAIAKSFWQKSEFGNKIKSILGPALDSIKNLNGNFDLVFIDADKTNYLNYLKACLPLLSQKGMIVLDNCLWSGKVLENNTIDADTKAIQEVNSYIASNPEIYGTLLPVRDGMFLVKKK